MAVLTCGTNVFEGTATGEAEHPIPAEAFTKAERIAKQNARDLRDHYAALKCPPERPEPGLAPRRLSRLRRE
ncbi:MAG: hypothetical protein ACE5HT_17045 [Gemmatimonadales bacterium]